MIWTFHHYSHHSNSHVSMIQTHTSPETRHVAIYDECRQEPMSVRLSSRKPVVWRGNIWIRNECISQRGLCPVVGLAVQDGDEDRQMKAWIWICSSQLYGFWRSGLHRTNKMHSFSNYVVVLVFFIVLLSVIVCWRKHFCGPWQK